MIPIKFSYVVDGQGNISNVSHRPLYEKKGWGWSAFDTFVQNVSVGEDKKSFKFTIQMDEWMCEMWRAK